MTRRGLQAASLLLVAALAGCGACSDQQETRRIDLGVERPRAAEDPSPDAAPPADEVAAQPSPGEGGERTEDAGSANATDDRPAAATGSSAAVGAGAPQTP